MGRQKSTYDASAAQPLADAATRRRPKVERLAYSKAEVAASLGVSVDFIEDHVWHELKIVRRGAKSLVPVAELEHWLDREAVRTIE